MCFNGVSTLLIVPSIKLLDYTMYVTSIKRFFPSFDNFFKRRSNAIFKSLLMKTDACRVKFGLTRWGSSWRGSISTNLAGMKATPLSSLHWMGTNRDNVITWRTCMICNLPCYWIFARPDFSLFPRSLIPRQITRPLVHRGWVTRNQASRVSPSDLKKCRAGRDSTRIVRIDVERFHGSLF